MATLFLLNVWINASGRTNGISHPGCVCYNIFECFFCHDCSHTTLVGFFFPCVHCHLKMCPHCNQSMFLKFDLQVSVIWRTHSTEESFHIVSFWGLCNKQHKNWNQLEGSQTSRWSYEKHLLSNKMMTSSLTFNWSLQLNQCNEVCMTTMCFHTTFKLNVSLSKSNTLLTCLTHCIVASLLQHIEANNSAKQTAKFNDKTYNLENWLKNANIVTENKTTFISRESTSKTI